MSPLELFKAYAARFEEVFVSDDWSRLEPFFHPDAVYEMVGEEEPLVGRDQVFAGLKRSLDSGDRLFDTRRLNLLEGPEVKGDTLWFSWRADYTWGDLPKISLVGEETITFEGHVIVKMVDRCTKETIVAWQEWMALHGDKLKSEKS